MTGCEGEEESVFERRYVLVPIPGYEVQDYVAFLDHEDANVRYLGVANLLAADAFSAPKEDASEEVKALAERLRGLLADPVAKVRAIAAYSMADWDDPETGARLVAMLGDESDAVRVDALAALGNREELSSGESAGIASTLNDENILVRLHALTTLASGCSDERQVPIAEQLVDRLGKVELHEKFKIVETLGGLKSARAEEALRKMLASDDDRVIDSAVEALARMAPIAAENDVLRALDEGRGTPTVLLSYLGGTGTEKSLGAIITRLEDDDSDIRARCREILAESGDERARRAMISAMNSLEERAVAQLEFPEALGRSEVEEFFELLHMIAEVSTGMKSENLVEARDILGFLQSSELYERLIGMIRLQKEGVFDPTAGIPGTAGSGVDLVAALLDLARDDSAMVRMFAVETLSHCIDPRAGAALSESIEDPVFEVRHIGLEGLASFSRATGDATPLLKIYARRGEFTPKRYEEDDAEMVLRTALEDGVASLEPSWNDRARWLRDLDPENPAPTRLLAASRLAEGAEGATIPVLLEYLETGSSAEKDFAIGLVKGKLGKEHVARLEAIARGEAEEGRKKELGTLIEALEDQP